MKNKRSCHIKVGDKVKVITGTNKGIVGTINSILFKKSIVFIEEILPRIKYIKNTQGEESKKVEIKTPIHISNVMLWDKEANLSSKIGYKLINNEKKRYFKKAIRLVVQI